MFDFNDAQEQVAKSYEVIPNGTFLDCELTIKPGGHDDFALGYTDGVAKKSNSGAVYLEVKLKVTSPQLYANRVIFDTIGLQSANPDEQKAKIYTDIGRSKAKGILCSHWGINPRDIKEADKARLKIAKLADLNNKQVVVQVKEVRDNNGNLKNEVSRYITRDIPQYNDFRGIPESSDIDDSITF